MHDEAKKNKAEKRVVGIKRSGIGENGQGKERKGVGADDTNSA